MATTELTTKDLNTLLEAVEAWEHKDVGMDLVMDLFSGIGYDMKDPVQKAKYEQDIKARAAKKQDAVRERKNQSILLRAKLIQIIEERRDSEFVSTFGAIAS